MVVPLVLTSLDNGSSTHRIYHGRATAGTLKRFVHRMIVVGREVSTTLPRDALRMLRPAIAMHSQDGFAKNDASLKLALYVHYSPTRRVSQMVLRQLDILRDNGFAVVVITMAASLSDLDRISIQRRTVLLVHRENVGYDFGAWRDLMTEVSRRGWGKAELLLINDSVLGPIQPMQPIFAALRAGGPGLFGLTESLQGGPHLQSYFLLARGEPAISDLRQFLAKLRVSHSKWLTIQRGELRLARWMRARGHRVAALFGYMRVVQTVLDDPKERKRVAGYHRRLAALESLSSPAGAALLREFPLNPTHHFWHVLTTRFGYPYLKTELVLRNPGRLPDVTNYATVISKSSPVSLATIKEHLGSLANN